MGDKSITDFSDSDSDSSEAEDEDSSFSVLSWKNTADLTNSHQSTDCSQTGHSPFWEGISDASCFLKQVAAHRA
jgi:hypothetical protein